MDSVTVIIPSRNEIFLQKTIQDIIAKAKGDIEVIAILDGYWPVEEKRQFWSTPAIIDDPRVRYLHFSNPRGMRNAINSAAAVAKGKYLMKCDAHCMFAEGFDQILSANCEDNWIAIPRRKRLDAELWAIQDVKKPDIDYHFLDCPITNLAGYQMHGVNWPQRSLARAKPEYDIDDTMTFQGSSWFMSANHFKNRLHWMSEEGYGSFCQEPQEIGNKTWLSGGRIVVNKKTWYAHLHKGAKFGRGYFQNVNDLYTGHTWGAHHWMRNEEPDMTYKFEWLVDKFWPVPTWPDDWKSRIEEKVK